MDNQTGNTLFHDVTVVQNCLEDLDIFDYDANRIYELLENHAENQNRVHVVVQIINKLIADDFNVSDYDPFSPEVVELSLDGRSESSEVPLPVNTDVTISGDLTKTATATAVTDINNSDQNNNGTPDVEESHSATPTKEIIFKEAVKISKVVPQCTLDVIQECLKRHEFSRNRVQIVTHELTQDSYLNLSDEDGKDDVLFCPIPAKKSKSAEDVAAALPSETKFFFSPISNRKEFSTFFGGAPDQGTKTVRNGQVNCTIVRPITEEAVALISAHDPNDTTSYLNKIDKNEERSLKVDGARYSATVTSNTSSAHTTNLKPIANSTTSTAPTKQADVHAVSVTALARPASIPSTITAASGETSTPSSTQNPTPGTLAVNLTGEEASIPSLTRNPVPSTFTAATVTRKTTSAALTPNPTEIVPLKEAGPVGGEYRLGEKLLKIPATSGITEAVQKAAESVDVSRGAISKELTVKVPKKASVPAPPHKFLKQAKELFPHVQVAYLEQLCTKLRPDEQVEHLISMILDQPDLPLKEKVKVSSEMTDVLPKNKQDEQAAFQSFLEILPDADPEFLETSYKSFANDQDELKRFVANALENRDYPTFRDYEKRLAHFALEKQFRENFNLEKFLELFPDPFTTFKDPNRPKTSNSSGRAFLMARYRSIRCVDIDKAFRRNGFRLYLACKELDTMTGKMRPRPNHEIVAIYKNENNLEFLQEVAFIENEDKIIEHIKKKEDDKQEALRQREHAFAMAKTRGELLTCGCCFDEELLDVEAVTCCEGHFFCRECVKKGAEVQIGQAKTDFPCLQDCSSYIRMETLEMVLLPSVFARLMQRKQMEEVKAAGIEEFETCPFCDFGLVPLPEDRVFTCQNPNCLKKSCRLCKELSHIPLRCDEVEKSEEVKARVYIENKMTEALVRTCWKCQKKFVKSDGCNKMTCTCGALMCYLCRQPVKDYSHFNGQGGDAFEKCPLYSNNNEIHATAVAEEAKKAKEEMAAQNPTLEFTHDPTLHLPEMPPAPAPNHGADGYWRQLHQLGGLADMERIQRQLAERFHNVNVMGGGRENERNRHPGDQQIHPYYHLMQDQRYFNIAPAPAARAPVVPPRVEQIAVAQAPVALPQAARVVAAPPRGARVVAAPPPGARVVAAPPPGARVVAAPPRGAQIAIANAPVRRIPPGRDPVEQTAFELAQARVAEARVAYRNLIARQVHQHQPPAPAPVARAPVTQAPERKASAKARGHAADPAQHGYKNVRAKK